MPAETAVFPGTVCSWLPEMLEGLGVSLTSTSLLSPSRPMVPASQLGTTETPSPALWSHLAELSLNDDWGHGSCYLSGPTLDLTKKFTGFLFLLCFFNQIFTAVVFSTTVDTEV